MRGNRAPWLAGSWVLFFRSNIARSVACASSVCCHILPAPCWATCVRLSCDVRRTSSRWRVKIQCSRAAILFAAAGTLLTACVDSERVASNLGGPPAAARLRRIPVKQTLASKVLALSPLRRVTKRKADPARLNELH